jgi:hypothetical protein
MQARVNNSHRPSTVWAFCAFVVEVGTVWLISCTVFAQPKVNPVESKLELELIWNAPAKCPGASSISAEIEQLIGRPLAEVPEPTIRAIASVVNPDPGKWHLRLHTRQGDTAGERELVGDDCGNLARATALILALSIDPKAVEAKKALITGGDRADLGADQKTPSSGADEPAAKPSPLTAVKAESTENEKKQPEPGTSSQPAQTPAPKSSDDAIEPSEEPDSGEPIILKFGIGANFLLDIGSLPGTGVGVGGSAGVLINRWWLELVFDLWFKRHAELALGRDFGRKFGADLHLWVIAPGVCYWGLQRNYLQLGLCARGELGQIFGRGTGVEEEESGATLWFAPLLGVRALWTPTSWFGVNLEAGCAFPVLRRKFMLDIVGLEPQRVHQPTVVVPRARVGVQFIF